MKNLDRIYGLSKSQILLDELSSHINLDYFVRSQTNQLLSVYKEKKTNWNESDSDYIVRIAIFVASKLKNPGIDTSQSLSLTNMLKDLQNLHDFMVKLKDFITIVPTDARIRAEVQGIISSYAFSLTLYNKYEEIWANLKVPQSNEFLQIKKIGWSLFLLGRVNLIQRRSEIVECACMLVAVIYVLICNCSLKSFAKLIKNEVETLNSLSTMIKGQAEQIKISATHLKRMLELFLQHHIVQSENGIGGVFNIDQIESNYEKLSLEYVHKLLPSEFDQRLFIEHSENLSYFVANSSKFVIKSCLSYDFTPVSPNSGFFDVDFKQKEFAEVKLLEIENWLANWAQENSEESNEFDLKNFCDLSKINLLIKGKETLFLQVVKKISLGDNREKNFSSELAFKASMVIAIEIFKIVFSHKLLMTINDEISLLQVPCIEVWKLLKIFTGNLLPKSVYTHLKEQQIILFTSLLWQDKKFVSSFKSFLGLKKENSHNDFRELLNEILFYSNYSLKELCNLLSINERIQEEIWNIFKSSVFNECEILHGRDVHQIIICSIYGVCKAKNLNVTFNSIIQRLTSLDPLSECLFRKIEIDESIGDIIKYYNEEYLKYMKSYLLAIARSGPKDPFTNPLGISNMNFDTPSFGFNLQSPTTIFSPYFTPNSRNTFEFGESPIESLRSFNTMISKTNRNFLNFEDEKTGQPIKKPKLTQKIYEGDDIIENLPDFSGFKDD